MSHVDIILSSKFTTFFFFCCVYSEELSEESLLSGSDNEEAGSSQSPNSGNIQWSSGSQSGVWAPQDSLVGFLGVSNIGFDLIFNSSNIIPRICPDIIYSSATLWIERFKLTVLCFLGAGKPTKRRKQNTAADYNSDASSQPSRGILPVTLFSGWSQILNTQLTLLLQLLLFTNLFKWPI